MLRPAVFRVGTFREGGRRTFDLAIGADGLHSHTRGLLFGPDERFHRYLGYCFAGFTLRDTFGLVRETTMWNAPGRAAVLYAVGDDDGDVHGFLDFARAESPSRSAKRRNCPQVRLRSPVSRVTASPDSRAASPSRLSPRASTSSAQGSGEVARRSGVRARKARASAAASRAASATCSVEASRYGGPNGSPVAAVTACQARPRCRAPRAPRGASARSGAGSGQRGGAGRGGGRVRERVPGRRRVSGRVHSDASPRARRWAPRGRRVPG